MLIMCLNPLVEYQNNSQSGVLKPKLCICSPLICIFIFHSKLKCAFILSNHDFDKNQIWSTKILISFKKYLVINDITLKTVINLQ